MKQPILYIKHKIKGMQKEKRRNALVFLRVFLMHVYRLSYIENATRKIKLGDIFNMIAKQSQFMLILIASIPLALPIPYPPGIPTVLGIPVTVFIINACMGRKFIKMPKSVMLKSIKIETIKHIVTKSKVVIRILARLAKGGRISFIADKNLTKIHAFFMLIMAILILTPFPGTNYLPSVAIFFISLGIVLTDGVLVIFGYLVGFIGIFLVGLFFLFGSKIIAGAMEYIKAVIYSE